MPLQFDCIVLEHSLEAPLLKICLQKEVRRVLQCSLDAHPPQLLQQHLQLAGLDFFDYEWNDNVTVVAAAHVMSGSACDTGVISCPSQYQSVPWAPLTLEVALQPATTYL
jgi:hypothetical protein